MSSTKQANEILTFATEYRGAGISVIPLKLDGSKSPALPSWKEYQNRMATDAELTEWFARPQGIGLVAGVVSGGLEVIDFDDGELFAPWYKSVEPIACWLPIVETPSLGFHIFYRCEKICGNQKIAMNKKRETLIETRGEGGYVCGAGSPWGIHRDGLYIQHSGPSLPEIPTISAEDRKALWQAARVFDEVETLKSFLPKPKSTPTKNDGDTPWDDFNRRAGWSDVLKGWTESAENKWTRPGKANGLSAMVRKAKSDDAEVLVVFSSNAGAIAPIGDNHRTLGKFEAFKHLQYNGDGKAATKAVVALGYGGSH